MMVCYSFAVSYKNMCITLCCVSNADVKNALKNAWGKKKTKHFQWHMHDFGKREGGGST